MARRLSAFALAFIVAAAPVASEICQVFCENDRGDSLEARAVASHHQHSADSQREASHHHHPAAEPVPFSTTKTMHAVAHPCGEVVSTVVESREIVRAPVTKGVTTTPSVAVVVVHVLAASDVDSRHGPPGSIRTNSPLRI